MALAGICTRTCTTPQHGYVERGRDVEFDLPSWDLKKFPYLKHFKEKARAKNPQLSIDEGATAARLKAVGKVTAAQPLGVTDPAAAAPATEELERIGTMAPEVLDDVTVEMLVERGQKLGVELDVDTSRTDLILAVIEAEEKADAELFE